MQPHSWETDWEQLSEWRLSYSCHCFSCCCCLSLPTDLAEPPHLKKGNFGILSNLGASFTSIVLPDLAFCKISLSRPILYNTNIYIKDQSLYFLGVLVAVLLSPSPTNFFCQLHFSPRKNHDILGWKKLWNALGRGDWQSFVWLWFLLPCL